MLLHAESSPLKLEGLIMFNISHRIHGAPINISPMLAYTPYMDPMGYGLKAMFHVNRLIQPERSRRSENMGCAIHVCFLCEKPHSRGHGVLKQQGSLYSIQCSLYTYSPKVLQILSDPSIESPRRSQNHPWHIIKSHASTSQIRCYVGHVLKFKWTE